MPRGQKTQVQDFDGVLMQQCCDCTEWKPLTNEFFATRRACWTGFNPLCKVCSAVREQAKRESDPEWYETHKAKARQHAKAKYTADPDAGREKARLWREANPDKQTEIQKRSQEKRFRALERYGLTEEDYDRMLAEQGGVCAVKGCGRTNGKRRMHVDHDHACCPGVGSCGSCVRGLVCGQCNKAMGLLRDNPTLINAVADYIVMGGFQYEQHVGNSRL